MQRTDRRAAFDRWDSLGWGLGDETEQQEVQDPAAADLSAGRPRSLHPLTDLVFSGTLYVDMVLEEVPVP